MTPWSELFLLCVVGFVITEMECNRPIYTIARAKSWAKKYFFYDNLQYYISSKLKKEHNTADNR